jgi:hypothetical protein
VRTPFGSGWRDQVCVFAKRGLPPLAPAALALDVLTHLSDEVNPVTLPRYVSPFDLNGTKTYDAVAAARDWAPSLPAHLRATWIILATFYPNIFATVDTLAQLAGKSRATMARYLRELEEIGAIVKVRRGRGDNSRSWRMLVIPELGMSPAGEPPRWTAAGAVLAGSRGPKPSAQMRAHLVR